MSEVYKIYIYAGNMRISDESSMLKTLNLSCEIIRTLIMPSKLCPIVISGPSGGGKSTIINMAMENYPNCFALSVSHTTRAVRSGEENGKQYWFIDRKSFQQMIENNDFMEYAEFGGNLYGTSKQAVKEAEKTRRICVLDLELNGVINVKKFGLNAKYIFVRAPDFHILECRLSQRKTESEESLQKRLKQARIDWEFVSTQSNLFDRIIVNDHLERAYAEFIDFIGAILDPVVTGHQRMAKKFSRLPPLPALRDFIHMYNIRAKKILSQNFLMDMNLTRKIVRRAGIKDGDVVVEIGPGPGGITRAILETDCARLDVVELDQRFLPALRLLGEASGERLNIHHGDILKVDIASIWSKTSIEKVDWFDQPPSLHIIGNLPFNIASPLIIKYLREMHSRQGPWSYGRVPLTLTFQIEVARRLVGPIDSDDRSRISIMSMFITEPKVLFQIPGRCFVPQPEIDVGVVRFIPRSEPLISCTFELVEKVCRHVFIYRNKYVMKCLKTLYPMDIADDLAHELLSRCRISPKIPSYRLGIEQISDMCLLYEEQCSRIPGLYLYNYLKPKTTLEQLSKLPHALPPKYPFSVVLPSAGISLSNINAVFK